ncbi:MAG: SAM-dependent DNA methyltransferase [Proteobacteria bacterium]|nr:SAM-dependent DNA methyltransferase [Pseudomonadota bacterium]
MNNFQDKASFIWSVADLLRGDYKQYEYQKVILPLTVLRRLDCVLEPTKEKVLKAYEKAKGGKIKNFEPILNRASRHAFHNRSKLDFKRLKDDPNNIATNLGDFINGFSERARDIIEKFRFDEEITRLDDANILYLVISKFAEIDLHPDVVPNTEMGYIFEELIRKFAEQSNETAGEHFTPREVIRLMVNVLFHEDEDVLTKKGIVKTLYDPACGTGGMLSVAEEYLNELNPDARLEVFGQELNDESFAICNSDMMLKGQDPDNIKSGNSFTNDHLPGHIFDYMLSNPPFGVEWKKAEKIIKDEHEKEGFAGRFGAGLPRINDGSLLFLEHMIDKMKPEGARLAIVFNGSPLFTGAAGSGESEIRRWIIENDWLEAIIAMPDQLFYNTGILTYIWVLTNRKAKKRRSKIQLINGATFFEPMRKSLGNKRHEISEKQIADLTRIHGSFRKGKFCKIFDNDDFGYQRITVERPLKLNFQASKERIAQLEESKPLINLAKSKKKGKAGEQEASEGGELQQQILNMLRGMDQNKVYKNRDEFEEALKAASKNARVALPAPIKKAILTTLSERDESADVCTDKKGNPEPDTDLRDYENVPLKENIQDYFKREVLPHVPDAWIDESKTKMGYEIPFTRHFYEYTPPRPLKEIETEIHQLEGEIQGLLEEVMG